MIIRILGEGQYDVPEGEVAGLDSLDDHLEHAVELLSQGLVLEWETEALVDECAARAEKDGVDACAERVGGSLKQLGQGEAGLFVAALVARATKGVAKSEAEVIKSVGKAAGVSNDKIRDIVKRATSIGEE